ncbi:MAG: hypothetical protein MK200_08665, partial [Nitrosopumilus sp.]|nr:hypothetical protein [Nitrosopumilus sp.]
MSTSNNVASAELAMAEQEVQKSLKKKTYQDIPRKIKLEVAKHAKFHGTSSAIQKYSKLHPKYTFHRTTVNSWKQKLLQKSNNQDLPTFTKAGRPNLVDEVLMQKVKDIIVGTRLAGCVVNRRQVICIGRGVIMANDPNQLQDFGGDLNLTEGWARGVLKGMEWVKRKGTTGKVEPSPQFLAEEKFTFQRDIAS